MRDKAVSLLLDILKRQLDPAAVQWLTGQRDELKADPSDTNLHIALGMAPRKLGKSDLAATDTELSAANDFIAGWDLTGWSVPDAARAVLLCSIPDTGAQFAARLKALCQTADVAESVALFRALPLYPADANLEEIVADGLRTNMKAVFEAIAHRNPYPNKTFDQHRWNHMVLKALFIDSRLAPIQGLDERANPDLARIMRDFAHERWAAERPVPFEIWRCVGPHANDADSLADLTRVLQSSDNREQRAGVLALTASPDNQAKTLLESVPDLAAQAASGALTWQALN